MILTMDVGNTNIKTALFEGGHAPLLAHRL